MLRITTPTKIRTGCNPNELPDDVLASSEPVILRGLVSDWPLVRAGLESDLSAGEYLRPFYSGKPVGCFFADSDADGRYFYNADLSGFNFSSRRVSLHEVLDELQHAKERVHSPGLYVGSTDVDAALPGLRRDNDLRLQDLDPMVSIWIGNRSRIACHFDALNNIACCVAGSRRFTLFPPDQIGNLYPGPLDFTPAGQAVSMVDFAQPDYEKYPLFAEAAKAGQIAELEPGDALFLPAMWWHHVEGLSVFNILINYWWGRPPRFMGQASDALKHALLSLRDLPEHEKQAWKHLFDFYVFGDSRRAASHLPESSRGVLSPIDEMRARKLRAELINRLNR